MGGKPQAFLGGAETAINQCNCSDTERWIDLTTSAN